MRITSGWSMVWLARWCKEHTRLQQYRAAVERLGATAEPDHSAIRETAPLAICLTVRHSYSWDRDKRGRRSRMLSRATRPAYQRRRRRRVDVEEIARR